jgi:hypothetical protein
VRATRLCFERCTWPPIYRRFFVVNALAVDLLQLAALRRAAATAELDATSGPLV